MSSVPNPGCLYALRNASMPGLLKIGRTAGPVEQRAIDLFTTGVPTPFEIVWVSEPLANVDVAERTAHRRLASHLLSKSREFFRIDLDEAQFVLEEVAAQFLDHRWLEEARAKRQVEAEAAAAAEASRSRMVAAQGPIFEEWIRWRELPRVQEVVWTELPQLEESGIVSTLGFLVSLPTAPFQLWWDARRPAEVREERYRVHLLERRVRRATAWHQLRSLTVDALWRRVLQCDWNALDLFGELDRHHRAWVAGVPVPLVELDPASCWARDTGDLCGKPAAHNLLGQPLCAYHGRKPKG